MSFEPQETGYSCGPASLRYALSLLGVAVSEQEIRAIIGNRWWHGVRGYGEAHLELAAKKLGLRARARSWDNDPVACLNAMRAATAQGHVCIASVHDDDDSHFHWMCVAGFEGAAKAVVLDPSTFDTRLSSRSYRLLDREGERVPALMAISRLKAWLTPTEPDDGQFFLELWPASPRLPVFRWHAGMTRLMASHPHFLASYDEYVDEMREVFGAEHGRSAADFIESARDGLLFDAARWMAVERQAAKRFINLELDAWSAIAHAYRLRVKRGGERRALTNLTYLLGWRAAEFMYEVGRYG